MVTIAGTLFFLLPGVYLPLRWSQVVPCLIDSDLDARSALDYSAAAVAGHYLNILFIWVIVAVTTVACNVLVRGIESMPSAFIVNSLWHALASTFGIALTAAIYATLEPWPERTRPPDVWRS